MNKECWYRYEETTYAGGVDQYGDPIPGDLGEMRIYLREIEVVRHTPQGVWLEYGRNKYAGEAFFRKGSKRQFACPTIEEAKISFIARKQKQASIHRARMADAEDALALAEQINTEKMPNVFQSVAEMPGWKRRAGAAIPAKLRF